jgi:hypothetical protein
MEPPDQITVYWCAVCGRGTTEDNQRCIRGHRPAATIRAIYTLALIEQKPGEGQQLKL